MRMDLYRVLPVVLVVAACGGRILSDTGTSEVPYPTSKPDASRPDTGPSPMRPDTGPPRPPMLPPEPEDGGPTRTATVIALGTTTANVPVSFVVPPNTLGFQILAKALGSQTSPDFAILDVVAPTGEAVHTGGIPFGGDSLTSITFTGAYAAVQVPQSPHPLVMPKLTPGTWTVTTSAEASLELQLQETPDGEYHGGQIDLHVYLPEGIEVDPAGSIVNAANAWQNQTMQDRVFEIFASLKRHYGLSRGTIDFANIPVRYADLDEGNLAEAFAETRIATKRGGLHLLLSQSSEGWWGVAPGIPGAVNTKGTDMSAIALTLLPEATPAMEGDVVAHELGHFIGLSHTTEFAGGFKDPLSDTPFCAGISESTLTTCPDYANVMFPSGGGDNLLAISAQQARVLQGSPIYNAFLSGTPPMKFVPRAAVRDYGRLFGHPGSPLRTEERALLANSCGTRRSKLSDATRMQLSHLQTQPGLPNAMKTLVRGLLK
jgi:hypothetical protein